MQLTEGTNDQLMALAAMRYCLGRRSYIVGACHEWLREVWSQLTTNSQNVILRDIVEALRDDLAGDQLDMVGWTHSARWMWERMTAEQRTWVQGAVGWRGIADVEAWLTAGPNDLGNRRDAGPIGGASVLTDELCDQREEGSK